MKWERVGKLGRELPEVEERIWYRTPSLKVRGKGFVRLKEDGASVVFMLPSVEEQEFLIETPARALRHYRPLSRMAGRASQAVSRPTNAASARGNLSIRL
jgi:hypothetical protein